MNIEIILPAIIGYVGCIFVLSTIPSRTKKILASAGNCKVELRRSKSINDFFVFIACFVLISLIFLGRTGTVGNYIISIVCIMGCELSARNFLVKRNGGMYENGIFLQHPFVLYDEIEAIPAFLWEDGDNSLANKRELQIVLKNASNVTLVFPDSEELVEVIKIIASDCPRLCKKHKR